MFLFSCIMTFTFHFFHLTGAANSPVQSSREIRIATAIFPTLSLLNHSCCPNTSLVLSTGTNSDLLADLSESVAELTSTAHGVIATVRAAKVITPGQEILHCYGKEIHRFSKLNKCKGIVKVLTYFIRYMGA